MGTFYVDNSGSPSCSDIPSNGAETTPWCTINFGAGQISSGDTLLVKNGTYAESFTIGTSASGSSGAPTTIKNFPGHTPTIDNNGAGRVKILRVSWLTWDGFIITDMNQGLFVEDSDNITVQNCTVHTIEQEGIRVKVNSFNILLQNNEVHNTGTDIFNGEGIYVGSGSGAPLDNTNNVTVKNNLVHDTDGEGIEIKPGTHDCIVEGNTLFAIEPKGFGAIEIGERDLGNQSWTDNPSHIIRNNTVRDSSSSGSAGIRLATGSTTFNNVIHDITGGMDGIRVINPSSDSFTRVIYHNTIDMAAVDAVVIANGTADVKNNIGPTTTDNIATSTAFYFDPAGDDFHTVTGSTPVDAGLDLTATVPTDKDGKTRPSVTPDIGAYELVDDWYAASCSSTDVQAAIDAAGEGQQVLVPPGTCNWSVQVLVSNKGITFKGAGIGVTNIVNGLAGTTTLRFNLEAGDSTTIVTGFTFDGNEAVEGGSTFVRFVGGGLDAFRLHNCDFPNYRSTALIVGMIGLEVSGLIDNNTFSMKSPSSDKSIRILGDASGDSDPFARGLDLGSEKFIFVEDNTFNFDVLHDGSMDSFGGARYVFRHNTINETNLQHHGADSGGFRGVHSFEVYENTFNKAAAPTIRPMFFRSATGVVFNNTMSANYGSLEFANFRSCDSFGVFGECDGTSIYDENQASQEGYACLDQIGHTFTENTGGSNILNPLYYWGNTTDGSQSNVQLHFGGSGECAREATHIVENRDWYDEDAAFDGTSGVGVGLLSNRPVTCTPIVAYWATDQNTLYQCNTTDTWTVYYTPFTYPHPLTGEVAAAAGGVPQFRGVLCGSWPY